jgi:iron complex transport system ATP-binding protein
LAQDPPLILDEPTTHLDLLHKVALFKLLKKTHTGNRKMHFVFYAFDMAIQLSDEMIIMTPEIFPELFIAKAVSTRYLKTSILF